MAVAAGSATDGTRFIAWTCDRQTWYWFEDATNPNQRPSVEGGPRNAVPAGSALVR
jgi:hypothetical protein